MSAFGTKRTFNAVRSMSAFPPGHRCSTGHPPVARNTPLSFRPEPTMTTGLSADHTNALTPVVLESEILVKSDKLTLVL